jgi:hypothetical protein
MYQCRIPISAAMAKPKAVNRLNYFTGSKKDERAGLKYYQFEKILSN